MNTSGELNSQIMREAIGGQSGLGSQVPKKRRSIGAWITTAVMLLIIVGASLVFMHRDYLYDWYRGKSYEPTSEMIAIRDALKLTDRGRFLFDAARPKLSESDEFNANCRMDYSQENAILGCYRDGDIYIYNIQADELKGIRELTTAHELLHAVWARMDETRRNEIRLELSQVLQDNRDFLEEELSEYVLDEKQEELYVRAGTEVADLPEKLEKHYAEIFTDQDRIVKFYDSYIVVFREIRAEMDRLMAEMEQINTEMKDKSQEYEQRFDEYEERVRNFNACAGSMGCFTSESEFYAQRNVLILEQTNLNNMYDEINQMVDRYNELVDQYNSDVMRGEELNRIINSMDKVEIVE